MCFICSSTISPPIQTSEPPIHILREIDKIPSIESTASFISIRSNHSSPTIQRFDSRISVNSSSSELKKTPTMELPSNEIISRLKLSGLIVHMNSSSELYKTHVLVPTKPPEHYTMTQHNVFTDLTKEV